MRCGKFEGFKRLPILLGFSPIIICLCGLFVALWVCIYIGGGVYRLDLVV